MFLLLIKLLLIFINISPFLFSEYLCPIDAYGWTLFDNKNNQIYQWIYNQQTEEFSKDFSLLELSDKYNLVCYDINQKMYQPIQITRKDFNLNWICDYKEKQGEIQIKSWLFNQTFSPKEVYLQIENFSAIKINQIDSVKSIRISFNQIRQIFENISLRKTLETISYELILNYGERYGSIILQIRPLFEERFYLFPLDRNHPNDSYIVINCSSTDNIENPSILWFNYTSALSTYDSKLYLQYSQLISSQLSCTINDCFTYIITHIRSKYF